MTAALLGMLVELTQLVPAFAALDERPEAALARVRPLAVMLLDGDTESALSDLFLARADRRGVGVAIFGVRGRSDGAALWARERHVPYFELPVDTEQLARILDQATRRERRERLQGDRRRASSTGRALDGTLVYFDPSGSRWYVYDRRGNDRRGRALGVSYRAFVNDRGEERRCALGLTEFEQQSVGALEGQLARAAPA